jgi:hypothetical protein
MDFYHRFGAVVFRRGTGTLVRMRAAMIKAFGEPAEVLSLSTCRSQSAMPGCSFAIRRSAVQGPFGVEWLWPSNAEI